MTKLKEVLIEDIVTKFQASWYAQSISDGKFKYSSPPTYPKSSSYKCWLKNNSFWFRDEADLIMFLLRYGDTAIVI